MTPKPETCLICGKPVPEYVPKYCCSGIDCGCQGLPLDPCVCSLRCADALFKGIGKPFEQRRVESGIPKWSAAPRQFWILKVTPFELRAYSQRKYAVSDQSTLGGEVIHVEEIFE